MDIPDDQWQRLVALIGAEGEDELLDRVIATRQKGRVVGKKVLHPKPYARLLSAIDAPPDQRPGRLREFVDNWYPELARKGNDAQAGLHRSGASKCPAGPHNSAARVLRELAALRQACV